MSAPAPSILPSAPTLPTPAASTAEAGAPVATSPVPSAAATPWGIFAIACVAVFLVSIDATVLYAAFPALHAYFAQATTADLSWVLNGYTIVYAALMVPAGRLADLYGRKRMFLSGTLLFLLASLACGLAGSVATLIVARVVQGIGAAVLMPASLAIVLAAFPPAKRAIVVSAWGAIGALAAALGPSIGSFLVDQWGWPWAFYLNLPLGAYSLWRGARVLVESRNPDNGARLDVVGVVLIAGAIGALAYGLVRSDEIGWGAPPVWGSIASGLALMAGFVAWSRRVASPAIDLALFAVPTYRYVNLATLSFGTAFAMMFFTFFLFLTSQWHYPLSLAGLAITPGPLLVVPVAITSGRIAAKVGHRALLIVGCAVFASSAAWFCLRLGAEPDYLRDWLPGLLLSGVGVGLVLPSLAGAAVARLAPNRFGVGGAVNQSVRQIGSVLGVSLTVVLLGHAAPTLAAFQHIYAWQIGLTLLTGLLCVPVDTRPRLPA